MTMRPRYSSCVTSKRRFPFKTSSVVIPGLGFIVPIPSLLLSLLGACRGSPAVNLEPSKDAKGSATSVAHGVVGSSAIGLFDALAPDQRDRIKNERVFFGHQSVGENIIAGAESLGFQFEAATSKDDYTQPKLGAAHLPANGEPLRKMANFETFVNAIGVADVAAMKLCWIDFTPDSDVNELQTTYVSTINDLIAKNPKTTFVHITPPLTTDAPNLNRARIAYGNWMKSTYGSIAVVFDLGEVISTRPDGTACEDGGSRRLCPEYASDSGHLNALGQERAAKAFLYAVYTASPSATPQASDE